MTTSPEHRIETRLELQETVFIEVLSAASDSPGTVIMCNSLDLSATGIQVVIDEDLAVNSILRLCIDLPDREPIFLVGEVMWKRPDPESDGVRLGFLLFESDDSDIADWKLWVAEMLNTDDD